MSYRKSTFQFMIAIIFICCLISCKQKEISPIEKIIVDEAFIKTKTAGYDSISINNPNSTSYYFKDSSVVTVYRDGLGRIRVWFKEVKGKKVDGAEVSVKTGQILGKLHYVDGITDGEVKYYYEDGRVRAKGVFKNDYWWGEWKHYDKDGNLEVLEYIDDNHNRTTKKVKE